MTGIDRRQFFLAAEANVSDMGVGSLKRHVVCIAVVMCLGSVASAAEYDFGGVHLQVPDPMGFVRVTRDMEVVYNIYYTRDDPYNHLLAVYISAEDGQKALRGEELPNTRSFVLKLSNSLQGVDVGLREFAKIAQALEDENRKLAESIKPEVNEILAESADELNAKYDIDYAMQVSQYVPMEPHVRAANYIAHSGYLTYNVTKGGGTELVVQAITATYVNVANRVGALYCYAPREELEWTRSASEAWAAAVLEMNPESSFMGGGTAGFKWGKLLERGSVGAITGALMFVIVGLVGVLLRVIRKSKSDADKYN